MSEVAMCSVCGCVPVRHETNYVRRGPCQNPSCRCPRYVPLLVSLEGGWVDGGPFSDPDPV